MLHSSRAVHCVGRCLNHDRDEYASPTPQAGLTRSNMSLGRDRQKGGYCLEHLRPPETECSGYEAVSDPKERACSGQSRLQGWYPSVVVLRERVKVALVMPRTIPRAQGTSQVLMRICPAHKSRPEAGHRRNLERGRVGMCGDSIILDP